MPLFFGYDPVEYYSFDLIESPWLKNMELEDYINMMGPVWEYIATHKAVQDRLRDGITTAIDVLSIFAPELIIKKVAMPIIARLAESIGAKFVKPGVLVDDVIAISKGAGIIGSNMTRAERLATFTEPAERSIAEYLENQGRIVVKNAQEGMAGAGRQGDAFMNGVKTEFKTLDPGATDGTIKNVVNKSISGTGQARQIIIDARNTTLSQEIAQQGTYRALGTANGKLDSIEVIGNGYFFKSVPR